MVKNSEEQIEKLNNKILELEERVKNLELLAQYNFNGLNPALNHSVHCPQCQQDISKNPVCGSVNCPYSYKVTCNVR